jgi:hypothetical protein
MAATESGRAVDLWKVVVVLAVAAAVAVLGFVEVTAGIDSVRTAAGYAAVAAVGVTLAVFWITAEDAF